MELCLAAKRRPGAKRGNAVEVTFADGELRGSVIDWWRRRHRRGRIGHLLPMAPPSHR